MSKCLCGAYDCGACYPATYKKYIAQEEGEEHEDLEEDEDVVRSERSGRER